jgi:RNA polymerase sigma factor (sigma-70 family)
MQTARAQAIAISEYDPYQQWRELAEGVAAGLASAENALFQTLNRSARPFFLLHLGPQHADELIPELFMTVLQSIRAGKVRDMQCLTGYVAIITRRMVARTIRKISTARSREQSADGLSLRDRSCNPEQERQRNEALDLMRIVLGELTPQSREILRRFYLDEEPAEQICREMGLTADQFRLLKWRAKERFAALAKKRLAGGVTRMMAGMPGITGSKATPATPAFRT